MEKNKHTRRKITTAKTFYLTLIKDTRFNETESELNEQAKKVREAGCWNILQEYPTEFLSAEDWKDSKGQPIPETSPDYGSQWRKDFKLIAVATRNQIYQWVNSIRPQQIKFDKSTTIAKATQHQ